MGSRWKHIDLLSLSSVTSAAAVRQRRQRPTPTPSPFGHPHSSVHVALAPRKEPNDPLGAGQCDHNDECAPGIRAASSEDPHGAGPGFRYTSVRSVVSSSSVAPVATGTSTPIRVSVSRLFCGSSLSWRSALECFFALTEIERHRRGSAAPRHETQCPTTDDNMVPLEVIVAVYGMLLRREALYTGPADSGHGGDSSRSTAEAAMSQSLCHNTSPASRGSASPLAFIAYASLQHASLNPIAVLLGSDRGGGVPERYYSCSAHENAYSRLLPLPTLTLSTILHLGFLESLQITLAPPTSLRTASDSTAGTDSTTASASLVRQLWSAVQAIHHMQCYGWAPDYLRSLAAIPAEAAGSGTATPTLESSLGEGVGRVADALALVRRAAHGVPYFTHLLSFLEGAWKTHHARFGALASEQQWPPAEDARSRQELPLTPWQQRTAFALAGNNKGSTELRSIEDASSMEMVHAIAAASTREGLQSVAATTDAVHGEICSMSREQLLSVTRNLVVFSWRAMEVRRRRSVGAAEVPVLRAEAPSRRTADAATGIEFERKASSTRSGPCQPTTATTAIVDEEQEALLRLVRVATRLSSFDELCAWMEQLISDDDGLVSSGMAGSHSRPLILSPQQEEALLCLLTRAVRRAPSWMAACTTLKNIWSKLPCTCAAPGDARPAEPREVWCRRDDGVASVPALLEAFFSCSHAPTAAPPSPITSQALRRWTPCDATFWYRVVVCGVAADTEAARWARILLGSDAHASSTANRFDRRTAVMERRHDSLTRAVLLVVDRWLRPAEALDVALQCLARSHARCANEWTTFLERQKREGEEGGVAPDRCSPKNGYVETTRTRNTPHGWESPVKSERSPLASTSVDETANAALALGTRRMADQHHAYCRALLSTHEQQEWLDLALRYVTSGPARQLIIKAAWMARWHCGPDTLSMHERASAVGVDGGDHPVEVDVRHTIKLSLVAAVADLTTVACAWVTQESEAPTGSEAAAAALFNYRGHLPRRVTPLGEMGRLMADVEITFSGVPGGASAVEVLFRAVRAAITTSGLHLERGAPPSRTSILASFSSKTGVPMSSGVSSLDEHSAVAMGALSHSVLVSERYSRKEVERRLARLRSWVELLCTCPTTLIANEQYVVVWLYVLMRQMEEMHGYAKERTAQLSVAPQHSEEATSDGCGEDERPYHWSLETEEAAVRRVTQSLSSQLWSVLPASSLLPPMLLNWLLTRGGERTWGDAVRTLRAAAGDDTGSTVDRLGRRFSLLALPLDRVVSVEHALRVLCTLRAVEERCATPVTTAKTTSKQQTSPPPPPSPSPRPQGCTGGSLIPTAYAETQCVAELGSSPAVAKQKNEKPSDTAAVADVYGRIESVLLREWYGRALAAVLQFFAEHPQHTYLTHVRDVPHHAALAHRRRQDCGRRAPNLCRETGDSVGTASIATMAHGTEVALPGQSRRPSPESSSGPQCLGNTETCAGRAFVEATMNGVSSVELWRAWVEEATAVKGAERGASLPQLATTASTDATVRLDCMRGITDLHSATSGSAIHTAVSCAIMQTLLHDGASSGGVATPSASTLQVPLYLLATFILQECRIGITHRTPFMGTTASFGPEESRVATPRRRTQGRPFLSALRRSLCSSKSPVSFLDVLMRDVQSCMLSHDSQNPLTGRAEAPATAPPSPPEVPTVHPELLMWFMQVLRIKQREREARQGSAATEETLEEVVAAVLSERCPEGEVLVKKEEKGGDD
ncbi:hypothetical protein JKF63_06755 [Porcisia hertigi]|uniref:Uncharacterized protein n=1 Tax=Porcisia hertigi TaxID=2761500 RepID=A0A836IPH8_9TRYP|nr:hypothetical protein JKF63_06755 [Porcisia hertigi]